MASSELDAYRALEDVLSRLGVSWYVFGGQAAILHGAVRFTEDIDVTVLLGSLSTRTLVQALSQAGFALRVDDVDDFVEKTHVLPMVHEGSHVPVDVVLGGPGLEELFADRAVPTDVGGFSVPVATAEDVAVMKVLAGRPKDLEDIVALARTSRLDASGVKETLALIEQALDQSDLVPLFEQCLQRARHG
jgi:hypothetical protein